VILQEPLGGYKCLDVFLLFTLSSRFFFHLVPVSPLALAASVPIPSRPLSRVLARSPSALCRRARVSHHADATAVARRLLVDAAAGRSRRSRGYRTQLRDQPGHVRCAPLLVRSPLARSLEAGDRTNKCPLQNKCLGKCHMADLCEPLNLAPPPPAAPNDPDQPYGGKKSA